MNSKPQKSLERYGNGRVPPNSIEVEEIILGGLMLERDAILTASLIITTPDIFYKPEHVEIYKSIIGLFNANQPIDLITVTADLRKRGTLDEAGRPKYLAFLTNSVGSAANIEYYCRVVYQDYIKRMLIKISSDVITASYDNKNDVFDIMKEMEQKLFNVTNGIVKSTQQSTLQSYENTVLEIENSRSGLENKSRVGLGFDKLGLFSKGNYIVIAGRPGMGKSTFGVSSMIETAKKGLKCIYFTLEMTPEELILNLICNNFGIDNIDLDNGKILDSEMKQVYEFRSFIEQGLIIIESVPRATIQKLQSITKVHNQKGDVAVVYLDYIQLCKTNNPHQDRTTTVGDVSNGCKQIALEMDVLFVAFAQLSREVEKRHDKRPIMSDLKQSGDLEQDADVVILLYRPEYYIGKSDSDVLFQTMKVDGEEISSENKILLDVVKFRRGKTREYVLNTQMNHSYFGDREFSNNKTFIPAKYNDPSQSRKEGFEGYKASTEWDAPF